MANSVSGIRRVVDLVSAMSIVVLTAPAVVQAEPPPPPPNPDLLIAQDHVQNASTPAERDDGHGLGVAHIGINAWMAITNQQR